MLKDLNNNEPTFDPKKGWNRFLNRIEEEKMQRRKRIGKIMRYAAILTTPLILAGAWYVLNKQQTAAVQTCFNTISTQKGETKTLKLADGTTVTLNAESEISYACHFTGKNANRAIRLIKGEALFEVTKSKEIPFSVDTKGLLITVHGTAFNINTYTETVKTTLLHGSISAKANGKEIYLKPNQQLSYAQQKMTVTNVDAQNASAWSRGILWFDNASLQEILANLQRNYRVTYQINEKHLNKHYTASFQTNDGLPHILKTLGAVSGLSFTLKNQVIVVQ